jgi:hypothetical protein
MINVLFVALLGISALVGCIHQPKNPLLKQCEDQLTVLNIDIQQKNERLRAFKQLNDDGTLR